MIVLHRRWVAVVLPCITSITGCWNAQVRLLDSDAEEEEEEPAEANEACQVRKRLQVTTTASSSSSKAKRHRGALPGARHAQNVPVSSIVL